MSLDVQRQISTIINWGLKISFGVMAFLLMSLFNDIHDSQQKMADDIMSIKERLSHIEGQMEK
jgi:hypothetical protein